MDYLAEVTMSILQKQKRKDSRLGYAKDLLPLLEQILVECNKKNIPWHHHMLFPNCTFNKHKGKWCIIFEDKAENRIIESTSENEPTLNLSIIEKLYYEQKK